MANLVPLQLDKDTGRIVAKGIPGTGGGPPSVGPELPLGCFFTCGYIFTQIFASDAWLVSHNTGLSKGLVQIYDDMNKLLLPDEVMFVDGNTILVMFATAITGKAYLTLIDDVP